MHELLLIFWTRNKDGSPDEYTRVNSKYETGKEMETAIREIMTTLSGTLCRTYFECDTRDRFLKTFSFAYDDEIGKVEVNVYLDYPIEMTFRDWVATQPGGDVHVN